MRTQEATGAWAWFKVNVLGIEPKLLDENASREANLAALMQLYNDSRSDFLQEAMREAESKDMIYIMDCLEHGDTDNIWVEAWLTGEKQRRADLLEQIVARYPRRAVRVDELMYCATLEEYDAYKAMIATMRKMYRAHPDNPTIVHMAIKRAGMMGIPAKKS